MGKKAKVRVKQMGGAKPPAGGLNPLEDMMIPPEDMIHLPVKPDSSLSYPWPLSAALDSSKYITIYPTYLDSNKTVKLGRRIAKADSVPEPTVEDLSDACRCLNLQHVAQPYKGYSRDTESRWDNSGRILVDLDAYQEAVDKENMNNGRDAVNVTKKDLMRRIAKVIPILPGRKTRVETKTRQKEVAQIKLEEEVRKEKEAEKAAGPKVKASTSTGGGNKKKGRKRR